MKKYTLSLIVLFLVISCSLESKYSLPNDENINPELIGEWYNKKDNEEKLIIAKHGEKTYKLLLKDKKKTDVIISFSKTIKGFEIMNLKTEYKKEITNVFYGFKVEGNTLIFSKINKKLRNKDFQSQNELLDFFKENINREDFFINKTELIRK
ncbi:hypothetical protein [Polaribacter aquimarinus]|uniref:Uncharacterized protein n=1 Tax=Polaribacter aquimarinus TaxID=2100726 RepID=A0A2U2JDZ1_9FLAO|nr:hypothetical protein [Polaribacter aquimarinus]PWG06491.1 hypothetical protein DIS07_01275 [Polaribacter aquimarinus]